VTEIHLLVQWFASPIRARHLEFRECLKRNVLNPHITHIHLLQSRMGPGGRPWSLTVLLEELGREPEFPFALLERKVVLTSHDFEDRLPASVVFDYASKTLRRKLCVFANLDIYFDDSLALLRTPGIDLNYMNFYFLSRYEGRDATNAVQVGLDNDVGRRDDYHPQGGEEDFMEMREIETEEGVVIRHRNLGDQCGPNFIGSHDSVVFVPPLPAEVIGKIGDVEIGSWGIENRLMWEFERVGIKVRNPCLDIRSWHLHQSLLKTGWTPLVNSENRSSVAHPQRLFPSPFARLRVDLQRGSLSPATLHDRAVIMLRNDHSVRCLFSRSDAKFGHARCTEDFVDQHFEVVFTDDTEGEPLAAAVSSPSSKTMDGILSDMATYVSRPVVLRGRESQMCVVAAGTWIGHQACLLPRNGVTHTDASLLWQFVSLQPQPGAVDHNSGDVLLMHTQSRLCVFSAITDNLGMVPCTPLTEQMLWKLDTLHPAIAPTPRSPEGIPTKS